MKTLKFILYLIVPLLFAAIVGIYFGYYQYFEELRHGSDDVDAFRWALVGGLLFSVFGLAIGLVFDWFIWLLTNSPKMENKQQSQKLSF
jgi:membrane protease YdiL (CAAX protease family)